MKPEPHSAVSPALPSTQTPTARPRLIVFERHGIWAARLRTLVPREIALRQTRSADECLAELSQAPASFLLLEATPANVPALLDILAQSKRSCPWSLAAAVAERQHAELEWLLREAGAVHFCTSPRRVGQIASLVVRHTARVPVPQTSLKTQVWESLPWPEAATS